MSKMMSTALAEDEILVEDQPRRHEIQSWEVLAARGAAAGPAALRLTRPVREDDPGARDRAADPWILVVDDEPMIRATVRDILELDGFAVRTADNGKAALELLAPAAPGLVVLDMRMPVMDGWEFARSLRARGLALPIIVMTAAQSARAWANEIGAAGWLAKPFDLDDLLTNVNRLCRRGAGDPRRG